MENGTIKDNPFPHARTQPMWRRRRYIVAFVTFAIIFWFFLVPGTNHSLTFVLNEHTTAQVDWSKYAYSQYATDQHYLCNSLMVFDSLQQLHSPADRLLFYPKTWDIDVHDSKDRISQLLVLARDKYKVKLRPVDIYKLRRDNEDEEQTWDASINKLHAWNEEHYHRIIHLDSDITLQRSIDELFLLPLRKGSPVAMPRAYWDDQHKLSSLLVVLEPRGEEAKYLWDLAAGMDNDTVVDQNKLFDMELLNARYSEDALVLPHRAYALVTGEFRRTGKHNHTRYLGNEYEDWDAQAALEEAKLIHFSDWPLPKPWIMWPNSLMREMRPECDFENNTPNERGCENRKIWMALYDDFRRRRKEVCRLLSVPAPDWPPKPKKTKNKDPDTVK